MLFPLAGVVATTYTMAVRGQRPLRKAREKKRKGRKEKKSKYIESRELRKEVFFPSDCLFVLILLVGFEDFYA